MRLARNPRHNFPSSPPPPPTSRRWRRGSLSLRPSISAAVERRSPFVHTNSNTAAFCVRASWHRCLLACLSACLCAMPAGLSARPPGWLPSCRSTAPASSFSGWLRPRLARGASPPSSGSRKPPPICQTSWLQLDYVRHKK